MRWLGVGIPLFLLSALIFGCGGEAAESSQSLLGRWRVVDSQGMNVPNSFFWFSTDYVEFRQNGTVWALVEWPPGVGTDIRLNKTAAYSLVGEHRIEFVGSCRHQDPCTGSYTLDLQGDALQIFDDGGRLELHRVGPPSADLPPPIVGPSPSPTPALIE